MVAVLGDPELYGFIGGTPPSLAELDRRYAAQAGGGSGDGREEWHNWIVRERLSGAATGFVQATVVRGDGGDGDGDGGDGSVPGGQDPREAEVAWLIGRPWQGRGYASEAARGLVDWLAEAGVGAIVAHVHPEHHASAGVARRAGLQPTDAFVDGERTWRRIVSAPEPAG